MVTCLAYRLDKELWKAIEYLKEQVKVLREQREKDKCILLDNRQRTRLAATRCVSTGRRQVPESLAYDSCQWERQWGVEK
jgi:hypothetical protein